MYYHFQAKAGKRAQKKCMIYFASSVLYPMIMVYQVTREDRGAIEAVHEDEEKHHEIKVHFSLENLFFLLSGFTEIL